MTLVRVCYSLHDLHKIDETSRVDLPAEPFEELVVALQAVLDGLEVVVG